MLPEFGPNYIAFGLLGLLLLILALIVWSQHRKKARLASELKIVDGILANLKPHRGLEENLAFLLSPVMDWVKADGYYFYVFNQRTQNYILKVARYFDSDLGNIAPSYSGLVPREREKYSPPVGLPLTSQPNALKSVKDGAVPLVVVPIDGGAGQIRIGPVRELPVSSKNNLAYLGVKLRPVLELLVEIDKMREHTETFAATSKAIQNISKATFDAEGALNTMLVLGSKLVDAGGSCLAVTNGGQHQVFSLGLDKEKSELLKRDHAAHHQLSELLQRDDFVILSRGIKDFSYVPTYLTVQGVQQVLLLKVAGENVQGIAMFWHYNSVYLEEHRIAAVQMLVKRIGDVFGRFQFLRDVSDTYADALKALVMTLDNFEPYTVSHSEQISRYAAVIARELRLSEDQVQEIHLAAYLHDIGMLGLSGDILFKPGKYSPVEYEMMKIHADVGAAIVEATLGKLEVAAYIRHHHERWDGYGYPQGLKGNEIPLGARIIGVADKFNASLQGRKYRQPESFEQALTSLMNASGSQLDPRVVEVLVGWVRRRQAETAGLNRALDSCWEMRCCPKYIAESCPAYNRVDRNCWEFPGVKCANHGNSCETCFIHTEFLDRSTRVRR